MTISLVQNTNNSVGPGASVSATFSSSVSTSNRLIAAVYCGYQGGGAVAVTLAVTDNKSNTWTKRVDNLRSAGGLQIWDCSPSTGGSSFSVTATASGTNASTCFTYIVIMEVSGLGVYDTSTTNFGTSTSPSITGPTLAVATEFVLAVCEVNSTSATVEGGGTYTNLLSDTNDTVQCGQVAYKITAATTAPTGSWTGSPASEWATAIAAWQSTAFISAALASTDTPDTTAVAAALSLVGILTSTEAQDVTAGIAAVEGRMTLASTEAQDVTAIAAGLTTLGTLAATEAPDVTAVVGYVPLAGIVAATENPDIVAIIGNAAAPPDTGPLASTDAPDFTAVAVTLGATPRVLATAYGVYLGLRSDFPPLPYQRTLPQ